MAIGISVYILELLVIFVAQKSGSSAVAAVGLSFWIGLVVSFGLQKFITFKDKRVHHKVLLPQILAFCALVLLNFGFTLLVTKLLQGHIPAWFSRTLELGITTIWNFYIYKTRIFKLSETDIPATKKRRKKFPVAHIRYAAIALMILMTTSAFWAYKSANLQMSNADQLVNPYLFNDSETFKGADLPGAHSFLLKWPLFLIIKLSSYSNMAYIMVTMAAVLITVAALAYVIYKIERRPLMQGTWWLALALALLMIPAQPYAGGLLPVNMGMLTTRNLEYIVYIAALYLFVKSSRFKSQSFLGGCVLLSILIASDKLFLSLSLGGSLLGLIIYSLARHYRYVTLMARWVGGSLIGAVGASLIIALINATKLTRISSSVAGPYELIHNLHDVALGALYALGGLLTNFGANPAYAATEVKIIPSHLPTF